MDELIGSISTSTWLALELLIIGSGWGNFALSKEKSWSLLLEDLFLGLLIGNTALLFLFSYYGPDAEFWVLILVCSLSSLNGPIIGRTVQSLFSERLEPAIKNLLNRLLPKLNSNGTPKMSDTGISRVIEKMKSKEDKSKTRIPPKEKRGK